MAKVIHLLPYDGIGGAEAAARAMIDQPCTDLDFEVRFLFPQVRSSAQRLRTWNPIPLLSAVCGILKDKPDLLIVSLWRSCVAGILVRLLRRRTRLVVLIHNSVDAHVLDRVFTRLAMKLACSVWADSAASIDQRFPKLDPERVTVIPFIVRRLHPSQPSAELTPPAPGFIFWGRLAAQKNLSRAIELFHRIRHSWPHAHFTVMGPDAGELDALRAQCAKLGLTAAVRFTGPLDLDGILQAAEGHSFYLQTSAYEGMAMSIVEAMQLGLVPVVTPVGEIDRYCRDRVNAVIVDTDDAAVAAVLELLDDPRTYDKLRKNAIDTWRGKPLYRDAVLDECRRLVHL